MKRSRLLGAWMLASLLFSLACVSLPFVPAAHSAVTKPGNPSDPETVLRCWCLPPIHGFRFCICVATSGQPLPIPGGE